MADLSRLPGPVADLWDWQLMGACRRYDPELFFHPEGERGPRKYSRDSEAKKVCASCPVLSECRIHALQVREPYGVWGGLTEDEREEIFARTERPAAVGRNEVREKEVPDGVPGLRRWSYPSSWVAV